MSGADPTTYEGAQFDAPGGDRRAKVVAKTADYTVTAADMGKIFTTRGASGAVTFTLPAASAQLEGAEVLFLSIADQNMTVATADEELVALNDLTADSIAFSTSSEKIGAAVRCVCDGTSWFALTYTTDDGSAVTTATIASA